MTTTGARAFVFKRGSTLGDHAIATQPDAFVSQAFRSGNIVASSLGDKYEFIFAGLLLKHDPSEELYMLHGQQGGKDIISKDGTIIESKFSDKSIINMQFNMTPPTPQDSKYFVFGSVGLPVSAVRSDILFKFLAAARGKIPDLEIERYSPKIQAQLNAHIDNIVTNWTEFRKLLIDASRSADSKGTLDQVSAFIRTFQNSASPLTIDYMFRMLQITALKQAQNNLEHPEYIEIVEELSEALSPKNLGSRRTYMLLRSELREKLGLIQKLFVIKYDLDASGVGVQAAEGEVSSEFSAARSKFASKVETGKPYSQKLLKKSPTGIVWFLYSYLYNPYFSDAAKENLLKFLSGSKKSNGGQVLTSIMSDNGAKNLVLASSFQNRQLVQNLIHKMSKITSFSNKIDQLGGPEAAASAIYDSRGSDPFKLFQVETSPSVAEIQEELLNKLGLRSRYLSIIYKKFSRLSALSESVFQTPLTDEAKFLTAIAGTYDAEVTQDALQQFDAELSSIQGTSDSMGLEAPSTQNLNTQMTEMRVLKKLLDLF